MAAFMVALRHDRFLCAQRGRVLRFRPLSISLGAAAGSLCRQGASRNAGLVSQARMARTVCGFLRVADQRGLRQLANLCFQRAGRRRLQ